MSFNQNKISVITPSFNQGQYLEETIVSVINQGYDNLELIIIDGNSSDNSVEIIHKYESHLTYWISEPDKGQSEAINKGLKKANGDIIMWLNSDDMLLPGTLARVNEYFNNHPNADIIHGEALLFGEKINEKVIGKDKEDLKFKYLAYIPFPQPSSFVRKKVWDKIGGVNQSLHYGMDFEFYAKAFLAGFVFMKVDDLFSKYRIHKYSKSNDDLNFAKDWAKVFSKILRSVSRGSQMIQWLSKVGIYQEEESVFELSERIDVDHLRKSLLYHLFIQAHYHYNALSLEKAHNISELVKTIDYEFYIEKDLGKLNFRSKYFPALLISSLRRLTRR
ncbi:MAG: glycosyltransferase [Sporocytophaga sp.]|uniref:glycosyltransferase family 2 protein n=1 Tax=Sporocytophaga sp. TaxID=2231183 RepID=UPI001B048F66|nr:glycosyltransferase family 2 protein [Sporocytophaga sp.]MBO9701646.1 glycosyltransferase [Sporocytophaga sp.]